MARSGPRAFRNGVPAAAVRAPERTRESAPATGELARRFDACLEFQLSRLPEHVRTRLRRRVEVETLQPGHEWLAGMDGQSALLVLTSRIEGKIGDERRRIGAGGIVTQAALCALRAVRKTRVVRLGLDDDSHMPKVLAYFERRADSWGLIEGSPELDCELVAVVRFAGTEPDAGVHVQRALAPWGRTLPARPPFSGLGDGTGPNPLSTVELHARYAVCAFDLRADLVLEHLLEEADQIVIVAPEDRSVLSAVGRRVLWRDCNRLPGSVHLAMSPLSTDGAQADAWGRLALIDLVHPIPAEAPEQAWMRLGRFLARRATAFFMTGHDARVAGNLGALSALEEEGRTPDVLAGFGLGARLARMHAGIDDISQTLARLTSEEASFDHFRTTRADETQARVQRGLAQPEEPEPLLRPCVPAAAATSADALDELLAQWCAPEDVHVYRAHRHGAGRRLRAGKAGTTGSQQFRLAEEENDLTAGDSVTRMYRAARAHFRRVLQARR